MTVGIDAAREECSEWYIAPQPQAHGIVEFGVQFLSDVRQAAGYCTVEIQVPVTTDLQLPLFVNRIMRGRQFFNSRKHRSRMGHIEVGQIFAQGMWIYLAWNTRHLQDGFDFAGEQQSSRLFSVNEGLLAEAIASQNQAAPRPIPYRKRKHSAQLGKKVHSPLFVKMDNRFRCRSRCGTGAPSAAIRFAVHGSCRFRH